MAREEFIIEAWERMGKEIVGASELYFIEDAVGRHFGTTSTISPAQIARVLADHGAKLGHPEILEADYHWRERHLFFTSDDLAFETIEAANAFIEKTEQLRRQFDSEEAKLERLRLSIRQIKDELELLATAQKVPYKRRIIAREATQWLTVWLQTPEIFAEWLGLRRTTVEYQELFGTFRQS
jgi:hypothetical protein